MDKGYKLQGCQVQKGPKLAISSFKKGQILKKENCFRISLNIVRFAHVVPKQAFKSTIYFNIQKRPKMSRLQPWQAAAAGVPCRLVYRQLSPSLHTCLA